MNKRSGWVELRKRILALIAEEFSDRCSIGLSEFKDLYIDEGDDRELKSLLSQYIPDTETLDEILGSIADRAGLERSKVKSLFDRDETVPEFAERLLRSGAFSKDGKGDG